MRNVDSACSAHDVQAAPHAEAGEEDDAEAARIITRPPPASPRRRAAIGLHARLFLDMTPPLIEQPADMLVVQPVEHEAAAAARPHQPQAAEQAQLMRDGGLARIDELGQLADAHFLLGQRIQQADAGRIAEHGEGRGQRLGGALAHQRPADGLDDLGRRVTHVAEIRASA